MKVVPLKKPAEATEIADGLRALLERVEAGEFETIYCLAIKPDGAWMTKGLGRNQGSLYAVGVLESLKTDILSSAEVRS